MECQVSRDRVCRPILIRKPRKDDRITKKCKGTDFELHRVRACLRDFGGEWLIVGHIFARPALFATGPDVAHENFAKLARFARCQPFFNYGGALVACALAIGNPNGCGAVLSAPNTGLNDCRCCRQCRAGKQGAADRGQYKITHGNSLSLCFGHCWFRVGVWKSCRDLAKTGVTRRQTNGRSVLQSL